MVVKNGRAGRECHLPNRLALAGIEIPLSKEPTCDSMGVNVNIVKPKKSLHQVGAKVKSKRNPSKTKSKKPRAKWLRFCLKHSDLLVDLVRFAVVLGPVVLG